MASSLLTALTTGTAQTGAPLPANATPVTSLPFTEEAAVWPGEARGHGGPRTLELTGGATCSVRLATPSDEHAPASAVGLALPAGRRWWRPAGACVPGQAASPVQPVARSQSSNVFRPGCRRRRAGRSRSRSAIGLVWKNSNIDAKSWPPPALIASSGTGR